MFFTHKIDFKTFNWLQTYGLYDYSIKNLKLILKPLNSGRQNNYIQKKQSI